jgi:hypothetical protein
MFHVSLSCLGANALFLVSAERSGDLKRARPPMGTASNAGSRMSGDVFRAQRPEHASLFRERRLAAPREIHSKEQMLWPASRASLEGREPTRSRPDTASLRGLPAIFSCRFRRCLPALFPLKRIKSKKIPIVQPYLGFSLQKIRF